MVRKIDEIPPEDWNRVFPNILEGYDFMKSVDEADFEQYLKTLSGATRYDLKRKFEKVDGRIKIDLEISDLRFNQQSHQIKL